MLALISIGLMMTAALVALTAVVAAEIATVFHDAEQRAFDRRFAEIVNAFDD